MTLRALEIFFTSMMPSQRSLDHHLQAYAQPRHIFTSVKDVKGRATPYVWGLRVPIPLAANVPWHVQSLSGKFMPNGGQVQFKIIEPPTVDAVR